MGLARTTIHLLVQEARRRPFSGAIATLGRQHVYATYDEVKRMAAAENVPLKETAVGLHREPTLAEQGFISDESLFELLAFSTSVRIDYSNYEAPDELLDLNQPETPEPLRGRFDVVLDSGTIEHVFDLPAALRHCCRMVKPGGRIIHLTPASNCVDHGFYGVSPTLFLDFYTANRFIVDTIYLCRLPRSFLRKKWRIYDYRQRSASFLPLGRLDGSAYFTFVVVTANHESTADTVPHQSYYTSTWKSAPTASPAVPGSSSGGPATILDLEPADSKAGRLLRATSGSPLLFACSNFTIRTWRKFINWYRERRQGTVPFPKVGRF